MIEKFRSHGFRDFAQRYLNSIGWTTIGDKKQMVQIARVFEQHLLVIDGAGDTHKISADMGVEFEFAPTSRGWYNRLDGYGWPVLIVRNPQRQWSRGINASNTTISVAYPRHQTLQVSLVSLGAVIWDKWEFREKAAACAISRQFLLTQKDVYFYNRVIGSREGKTLKVPVVLAQEIRDLIALNKLPLNVETYEQPDGS